MQQQQGMWRWLEARRTGIVLTLLLLIGFIFSPAGLTKAITESSAPVEIVASPGDKNAYRYLVLPNQLRVLLVSDAEAEKAAASLDIYVGSAQDPSDRGGLAHFLEHMLFLGTEKYPDAGEYQTFISANGGSHNAYTASEHTNYFFDVKAEQIEEALDRFAQFFVAPLFTAEYVDRERHAVHSEYKAKIKDDYRRIMDVYRQLVNPEHPMVKFTVGSLDTLADRVREEGDADRVRDDLLAFYQRYYSADIMTLVVLGRESLDQLEAMVRGRFALIPNRASDAKNRGLHHGQAIFDKGFLPAEVHIVPEKDQHRLSLIFPLPPVDAYYREKPLSYLGNLLGHEGKGSVLSLLKRRGWAEGLSAGAGYRDRDTATFNISISLSPEGVKNKETVISLVFEAIDNLRGEGVEDWRFEEQGQLGEIDFRFREKGEAIHTVSRLSNALHYYAPEDVLRGPYLYQRFDQKLIEDFLSYLRPDNVLVSLNSPSVKTDQTTSLYSVPYRVQGRDKKPVKLSRKLKKQLRLPEENPFIPQQLAVKSPPAMTATGDAATETDVPTLLKHSGEFRAWFKQEHRFQVPKANIRVRIKSPVAAESATGAANMQLFTALVKDNLNEFSYPAALAGLDYAISANSRGFDISIGGYNDRQGLLLTRILKELAKPRFEEERFENIKREVIRRWNNAAKRPPYVQLLNELPVTLFAPYWSEKELVAALERQTLAGVQKFASRLLTGVTVDVLIQGNLYPQEGLKLATLLERKLVRNSQELPLAEARVMKLEAKDDKPWLRALPVDHRDNAVALYVQGLADNTEDAAHMLVLRQVLRAPFYHELRTEKQLGYIVFATSMGIKEVPGAALVVQSPTASAEQLIDEIGGFIAAYGDSLPENLAQHQQAVIHSLLEQPKNQAEQASRYWENILRENLSFDRRHKLAKAVEAVTADSFSAYYAKVMQVPQRRMWLTSRGLAEAEHGFNAIEVQTTYKSSQPFYRYP